MSQENVEIVRGMVTRFAAGDRESWREVFAEDAVWDTSATTTPQAGVYEGHAGMERFLIDWLGTWVNPLVESLELTDAGDCVISVFAGLVAARRAVSRPRPRCSAYTTSKAVG